MRYSNRVLNRALRSMVCCVAAALYVLSTGASAQAFPAKPVRLIVPYPAGGLTDVLARGLALEIVKVWGQQLVIENRPGASQMIGAEAVARSAPDGYTIGMLDKTPLAINPFLFRKIAYDPVNDFAPILNVVRTTNVLVAHPSVAAKDLQELIVLAKSKPGEINYGTFGPGSITHLDTEALASLTATKFTHIPYKGIAEVLPAVLSGQIQIALSGIPPALPQLKQGRLKALAVTSHKRLAVLPDVPTFIESGVQLTSYSWFGLFAAAGTPRSIIDKIATDIGRIISAREFDDKFISGVGLELINEGPDKLAATVQADRATYAAHVRDANIKID